MKNFSYTTFDNNSVAFGASICGFVATVSYLLLFWLNALASLLAFFILKGVTDASTQLPQPSESIDGTLNQNFNIYYILSLLFILLFIFNQTNATYPLYLKNELGISISLVSWLYAINGVLIAFFQMPISNFLKNKNISITCAVGALLISLGLASLPLCSNNYFVIGSCIAWTLGEIIFFPAIVLLILKIPNKKRGKNIGLYQLISSISLFVSPALGMFVYSYDKNLLWYLMGIIGLLVSVAFVTAIKPNKILRKISIRE
jgi:predicted MFS family arabinose efflux permease